MDCQESEPIVFVIIHSAPSWPARIGRPPLATRPLGRLFEWKSIDNNNFRIGLAWPKLASG